MARQCEICSKSPHIGNLRSHSNIATKRRMLPNLQRQTIRGERMLVCTSCIKTSKKDK